LKMATIDNIITRAEQVRDETAIGANTATRVGGVMVDTAEHVKDIEEDIYDAFCSRASIAIKDNVLTLGAGLLYFVGSLGVIININHSSSETFTFTKNATSYLLINSNGVCRIVSASDLQSKANDEKLIAMYDGSNNRIGGLLYDYVNSIQVTQSKSNAFVTRASITINGNVLTLGAGLFYFVSNYGNFWSCNHSSAETITFAENATSFLLISSSGVCRVVSSSDLPSNTNEQILAVYDGSNKKISGPVRDFVNLAIVENAEKIEYLAKDVVYFDNTKVTSTSSSEISIADSLTIQRTLWYRFMLGTQDADEVIIRAYNNSNTLRQTLTFTSSCGMFKLIETDITKISISLVKRTQASTLTCNYVVIEKAYRDISLTNYINLGSQTIEGRTDKTYTFASTKPISELPDLSNDLYLSFSGSNINKVQFVFYKNLGTDNIIRSITNVEYTNKQVKLATLDGAEAYSIFVVGNDTNQVILDYLKITSNVNQNAENVEIPPYFNDEIDDCVDKVGVLIGGSIALTSAVFADTHIIINDAYSEHLKMQEMVLEKLHESVRIDSITHLGDLVMANEWNNHIHSQGQAVAVMSNYMKYLYGINSYLFATPGNHDGEYLQYYRDKDWDAIYNHLIVPDKVINEGTSFFYVDNNAMNLLRIYITNFDDINGQNVYGFSTRLLQWMVGVMNNAQAGRDILIFGHVPPYMASYVSTNYLGVTQKGIMTNKDVFIGICNAYNAHTSYSGTTYDNVSVACDFTNKSGKILCYISGHVHGDSVRYPDDEWTSVAHFNNETEEWNYVNDMPCPVVTIASGNPWIQGANAGSEGSVAPNKVVNSVTEECFDIMVYVKDSTNLNLIRFGAGNDRVIDLTQVL